MGGVEQVSGVSRHVSRVRPVQDLVRDARYALRVFRRHRTFSAVAVLTLALGIGATTAVFSVVNGVLLQPLAYPQPDRIVSLGTRSTETGRETPRLTGGDFLDVSAQRETFASLSPFWGGAIGVQVRGAGEFASVYFVAPSFFEVFGVPPTAGRLLGAQDGERAAIIGDGFAQRVFGGARLAIGQAVSVEDRQDQIVGVMPRGFDPPRATDVWLAMPSPLPRIAMNRTAFNFQAVARLRDGVSLERAQAVATALGSRLAAAFSESNRARTFTVMPLRDRIVSRARLTLVVLLGAVSLVLLIACANIANLLLARAATRGREIGLRAALGASRSRIGRQLVAESLLLSLVGGGLGLALAYAGTPALTRLAPADVPRLAEVAVDWRVLLFALACSLAASLLFGLVPAWHASRVNLNDALKQSSARGVVGQSNRLRGALVVAEIALSFVLAAGAAVLLRGFIALTETDLGYRPESVLVATAHVPARTKADYVAVARALARLSPELTPVPGVRAVGVAMGLPSGPYGSNGGFTIEGRPETGAGRAMPDAGFRLASPGYFAALGVALLGGRDFTDADTYDAPYVAIVSRALVNRDFAGENPIGRRIRCGLDAPDTWMTIVGVVGDVRQNSPASPPSPEIVHAAAAAPVLRQRGARGGSNGRRTRNHRPGGPRAHAPARPGHRLAFHDARADGLSDDRHATIPRLARRPLRGARAAARPRWRLRRDGVHRLAASLGVRPAAGSRGRPAEPVPAGRRASRLAGGDRDRGRSDPLGCHDERLGCVAARHPRARRDELRVGHGPGRHRRGRGGQPARLAGIAGGPAHGASRGIGRPSPEASGDGYGLRPWRRER